MLCADANISWKHSNGRGGPTGTTYHANAMLLQIEYDGDYPMEGAKGVDTVTTRYTAKLLRRVHKAREANTTLLLKVEGDSLISSHVPNTELGAANADEPCRSCHSDEQGAGGRVGQSADESNHAERRNESDGVSMVSDAANGGDNTGRADVAEGNPQTEGACINGDAASSCAG